MCEEQKLQYVTQMQLDEKQIRKMLWNSIAHSWRKTYYIVCGVVYLLSLIVLVVSAVLTGVSTSLVKSLLIAAVVGAVVAYSLYASVNTGVRRWKEKNHQLPVTVYAGFSDAGIVTGDDKICGSAQNTTMHYADIHRVYDMEETWIFRTKGGLLLCYNASQLSETDRKSVLTLLKSNNPKIKIQIKEKK